MTDDDKKSLIDIHTQRLEYIEYAKNHINGMLNIGGWYEHTTGTNLTPDQLVEFLQGVDGELIQALTDSIRFASRK